MYNITNSVSVFSLIRNLNHILTNKFKILKIFWNLDTDVFGRILKFKIFIFIINIEIY